VKTVKPAPAPEPVPSPEEVKKEVKPSGGDEAARLERRKKIEELEREARRLYESFTTDEDTPSQKDVQPDEKGFENRSATSTPTGGGTMSDIRFRAYYDRIWAQIRSSWVPQGVTSQASLITVVGIRIAASGEIEQFWIEKGSGNAYYDQSALRAIRKANPLPALPNELSDAPLEVGVNFRYPE
jgi:TonB family protein